MNNGSGMIQRRFLLRILSLFVLLSISLGIAVSAYYRHNMEQKYSDAAYSYAYIAADFVDGDSIAGYASSLKVDEAYEEFQKRLDYMRDTAGIKYLYVAIPREKDCMYIWVANGQMTDWRQNLGYTDNYYQGGDVYMKEAFSPVRDGEPPLLINRSDVYGYTATACVPVKDSTGKIVAVVGVEIAMDQVQSEIDHFLKVFVAFMIAIMLLAGWLFYRAISSMIIHPLLALDSSVNEYAEEKMRNGEPLEIEMHTGDEIERLAGSVVTMSQELRAYMRDVEKVTREKERIATELNVATDIQMHMLPSVFPPFPERKEFDIYATSVPAKEVGGDFYDFFLVDHDHIAVVMADVSGKGVPAALFLVIAKTLIKNRTQVSASLDPAKILYDVNNQLCEGNEAGMFVTVWLAILQISTGKGMVANAGHGSPMVLRAGGQYEHIVRKHSPGVAMMEGTRFKEYEIEMHPGDRFFVCTDGVTEAIDKDEELFGVQRLQAALNENPEADPKESLENVKKRMDAFVGEADQFDDITMLSFVYYGPPPHGKE